MQTFVVSHQVTVAKTLLNAKTGVVFICAFNPGEKPRLIKRGTLIASFIPVKYVSEAIDNCGDEISTVNEENSEMPQHLKAVYDDGCYHLTAAESRKFKEFLIRRERVFANLERIMERVRIGEYRIKLMDGEPSKEAPRRVPIFKREILDAEILKLEKQGLVEKSNSLWSSQLELVKKKDGSWRVCVDYRRRNAITVKDAYPIPRIEDDLDALAGSKWFTTLDLNMAYHQVPMAKQDKKKTAFATPRGGLFQYTVMPFGLCNAPATSQRIIEKTLSGIQWKIAVLFLDDIMVFGKNFEEHISNFEKVFDRLDEMNLKVKAKKCSFF